MRITFKGVEQQIETIQGYLQGARDADGRDDPPAVKAVLLHGLAEAIVRVGTGPLQQEIAQLAERLTATDGLHTRPPRLSRLEYRLYRGLLRHAEQEVGTPCPLRELITSGWNREPSAPITSGDKQKLATVMTRLRRKLKPYGESIVMAYGRGYSYWPASDNVLPLLGTENHIESQAR